MIYQTDATRAKILAQAASLFSEQGFFQTQMKDIAEAVGMSRNTLYRYYRDKFELGFAILEAMLTAKYSAPMASIDKLLDTPDINIRRALAELFADLYVNDADELEDRFIAEFDAFYAGQRVPEDFRERLTEAGGNHFYHRLDALVHRGQREGSIRPDIDPHILSTTLTNAIQAFHQRMILRSNVLIELDIGLPNQLSPILIQLLIDGLKPQ